MPVSSAIPDQPIDAVFLDVGGTLVGMDYEAIANTLKNRKISVSAAQIFRAEAAARPALSNALASSDRIAEDFFGVLMKSLIANLPTPVERSKVDDLASELCALIPAYGHHKIFWTTPLPEAKLGLQKLKSLALPLIAVSNSDGSAADVLKAAGFLSFFDAVIDSHDVGVSKPNPGIFDFAFDKSSAMPETSIYLGDIYAGDIVCARAAGLTGALIDPFDDYKTVDCVKFSTIKAFADTISVGN